MESAPVQVGTSQVADLHRLLRARAATVATAESLTGGRLASLLTAVSGASAVYLGGVVSYATRVKVDLLGVEQALVDSFGVISAECARAMADAARARLGADYALSTTGVAGPQTQDGHPVGTVFIALSGPAGTSAQRLALTGDRLQIAEGACLAALSLLRAELTDVRADRCSRGE